MPRTAAVIGAIAVTLALPAAAQAVVLPVTNGNDSGPGSLRAAVAAAGSGETVSVPPGTYRLTSGQLDIPLGITLQGQGAKAADVTISAEGHSRTVCVSNPGGVVELLRVRITGGVATAAGACGSTSGGGILKVGGGTLRIEETTISGNSASNVTQGGGGGGLGVGAGAVELLRSSVVLNSASVGAPSTGGAGIVSAANLFVENSTIGENRLAGGGGGSGLLTTGGTTTLDFVTIVRNSGGGQGGALGRAGGTLNVSNTAVIYNGPACSGSMNASDSGADDTSCPFGLEGVQPHVGSLFDQGGPTPTYIVTPTPNTTIDEGDCGGAPSTDQRGAPRNDPLGGCDMGAFEFDGLATADVPDCTRTGQIPFGVASPPQSFVEGFRYKIAGGAEQAFGFSGGLKTAGGTLGIPAEGRHPVEFWADSFPEGPEIGGEFNHHTPTVVVDRTNPTVAVKNPNKFNIFVIKRGVKVNVNAADSISGLEQNPSGTPGISTARRGTASFKPTAVDLCDNAASATFNYKVLAPALGTRLVVEELAGSTKVHASQKGQAFKALREPRELRIGSTVDSRKGRVRLTVSRDSKTAIQDSEFSAGLFQVLQSRKRASKGLTELRLKGSSFSKCPRAGKASKSTVGDDIVEVAARKVIRKLRGNGKGRFRTRGRYSAATVRGTDWTVSDRCDGTLTTVKRGRVAVRDFRRKRTITVRAGKSYLARR